MKILSNGCLQYLFQEIAYAKLIIANGRADFADAFQFVLISRRYFVEVFSNKIYVYHLTPGDAVLQLDEDENNREKQGFLQLLQVEFRIRAAGGYRGICRQRPLITLLKLVQAITEVEPCNGRDQYVVSVDDRNLEQSLYLMRNLYANRIPTVFLPNGGRYVMIEEFYDTISNDFSYHPRRLFGWSRALSYMGADADDPRVFQVVTVCDPQETTYDPFIFNIKTEKLCVHLSSVEECECLPYMPHLKMLECDYVPLGVFNNSGIDTYYEELSEKLAEAAPNLERLHLSCEVHAFCDTLRLAEEGTVQAGLAIHNSIKGLQSKIKKVGCSVEIIVRSNDDSVLDEVDDVCDHFRQKIKDNFKKAGITSSVDWDEVFFDLWSVEEGDRLLERSQGKANFLIFEVF